MGNLLVHGDWVYFCNGEKAREHIVASVLYKQLSCVKFEVDDVEDRRQMRPEYEKSMAKG